MDNRIKTQQEEIMEDFNGLTSEELKEVIIEHLKNIGIDTDTIEIIVSGTGPVVLTGKVNSDCERKMIKQTLMDVLDIEAIVDELVVIQSADTEDADSKSSDTPDLYDTDDETIGTEDAFQSVEDGIPYIPPSNPTYQESPETVKWKKKKKKQ